MSNGTRLFTIRMHCESSRRRAGGSIRPATKDEVPGMRLQSLVHSLGPRSCSPSPSFIGCVVLGRVSLPSVQPTLATDLESERALRAAVSYNQADRAPSLRGGVGWINSGPIALSELRGKIVLLDFWTFCCINCHHVLPDLAKLEEKYKNELVVIGVHSGKFDAERDTENIRRKVGEYRIKHPVINDAKMTIWNRFGVNSWPTLVLIDARGIPVGTRCRARGITTCSTARSASSSRTPRTGAT